MSLFNRGPKPLSQILEAFTAIEDELGDFVEAANEDINVKRQEITRLEGERLLVVAGLGQASRALDQVRKLSGCES